MKKTILTLLLFSIITFVNAQSVTDLFLSNTAKITWLGIDYSHVSLIGIYGDNADNKTAEDVQKIYFPKWNHLMLQEPNKFNFKKILRQKEIEYDIEMMEKVNAKAKVREIGFYKPTVYSKEEIIEFVGKYELQPTNRLGVLMIAESLNKPASHAVYHFVIVNMNTKEVLIQEKITGKPGGLGLRNYWAGSIYSLIKQIDKKYYKIWKEKFK